MSWGRSRERPATGAVARMLWMLGSLGGATWTQTPERKATEFALSLDSPMEGDTLILETDNGDNPPIELTKFEAFYPATRVLFKARPDEEMFLYYGNPRASSPRYDLSLIAAELLSSERSKARLGQEQRLRKASWAEGRTAGKGGVLFWGILALVVVGLLVVISRLRRGKNPLTTPGKDHVSHRLARLTGSRREAVLMCYLIGGVFGIHHFADRAGAVRNSCAGRRATDSHRRPPRETNRHEILGRCRDCDRTTDDRADARRPSARRQPPARGMEGLARPAAA